MIIMTGIACHGGSKFAMQAIPEVMLISPFEEPSSAAIWQISAEEPGQGEPRQPSPIA